MKAPTPHVRAHERTAEHTLNAATDPSRRKVQSEGHACLPLRSTADSGKTYAGCMWRRGRQLAQEEELSYCAAEGGRWHTIGKQASAGLRGLGRPLRHDRHCAHLGEMKVETRHRSSTMAKARRSAPNPTEEAPDRSKPKRASRLVQSGTQAPGRAMHTIEKRHWQQHGGHLHAPVDARPNHGIERGLDEM